MALSYFVQTSFDAAHSLPGYDGPCKNLHGHTWKVTACYRLRNINKVRPSLLLDFKDLKQALRYACEEYDHAFLNDLDSKSFYPCAENIAARIAAALVLALHGSFLLWVEVEETPGNSVRIEI
jgi:6-pyruvoyltetrahydropterin/6-carboxytetrahydropterin synthase